jgi:hypothetical protein
MCVYKQPLQCCLFSQAVGRKTIQVTSQGAKAAVSRLRPSTHFKIAFFIIINGIYSIS